jgi:hypothetical protein
MTDQAFDRTGKPMNNEDGSPVAIRDIDDYAELQSQLTQEMGPPAWPVNMLLPRLLTLGGGKGETPGRRCVG